MEAVTKATGAAISTSMPVLKTIMKIFASIQDVMDHHIDDVQTHETNYTGEFTAFDIRH